jgi:hypothetical protein
MQIKEPALPMDCYLDVVGGLVPLRCEDGRPKAVRDKVFGKGQQQYYWTEAVQVTNTDDRPDLSSEGAPDIDKTVNVKRTKLHGFGLRANYADRATAACWRSSANFCG